MTIHVVDYINTGLRHADQWSTMIPDMLRRNGYDVNVISGADSIPGSDNVLGETLYRSTQYNELYSLLISGEVSPKDLFIFADAWNPNAITLRYLGEYLKLKLRIIGVWRGGVFDLNSRMWHTMYGRPKAWAGTFERTLYSVYDYNCYFDEATRTRFLKKYTLRTIEKAITTGFPVEDVKISRDQYPPIEKQNLVVLAHDAVNSEQADIFKALRAYLTDFEFINCQDLRLDREEYYDVLAKAKVILAINPYDTNLSSIYEAMVFGCVPIVPDATLYSTVFPEQYRYPAHYVQPPFLNFVRGRQVLYQKIQTGIEQHEILMSELIKHTVEIGDRYFSNQPLVDLLGRMK